MFAVTATDRHGRVRRVFVRRGGGFTLSRLLRRRGPVNMSAGVAAGAVGWTRRHRMSGKITHGGGLPFLVLRDGAHWPTEKALLLKLDALGEALRRRVVIVSGLRTNAEQWALWRAYKSGTGNLAAYPGTSNHETGRAADCNVAGISVGSWPGARRVMRRVGLCLPVPGEAWHVQVGSTWRG